MCSSDLSPGDSVWWGLWLGRYICQRAMQVSSGRTEICCGAKGEKLARSEPPVRAMTAKAQSINPFDQGPVCGGRGVRIVTSGASCDLARQSSLPPNATQINHLRVIPGQLWHPKRSSSLLLLFSSPLMSLPYHWLLWWAVFLPSCYYKV